MKGVLDAGVGAPNGECGRVVGGDVVDPGVIETDAAYATHYSVTTGGRWLELRTSAAVLCLCRGVNLVSNASRHAEVQRGARHVRKVAIGDQVSVGRNDLRGIDMHNVSCEVLCFVVRLEVPELMRGEHDGGERSRTS